MILKEKEEVRDVKIADVSGLVKRGDAVISTDLDALKAYKKKKMFYRDFERLMARVDVLEKAVQILEGK